jgi:uncharacterized low-complexity protein
MKPLSIALGAAFVASLAGTSIANAAENPFSMTELSSGYMVADSQEGKCGEGMKDKEGMKGKEGKCGEGMKDKEGKCGGEKKEAKEGKCGEGKCGGEKKEAKEGKCGEGKCGGEKK